MGRDRLAPRPDVARLVELIARALEHDTAAMVAADEAHLRELGDDDGPRTRRDQAAETLYASVVELRQVVTGLYGPSALPLCGLSGPTPTDPATLSSFGGEVIHALRTNALPPSRIKGDQVVPSEWASRLKRERAALDGALADVTREAREADATLAAKGAAIAAWEGRYSKSAGVLSALLQFTGEEEIAGKVRRVVRQKGAAGEVPAPDAETSDPYSASDPGSAASR